MVIITEPQWKPSTESQAIARAHRLGQLDTVLVHRLLAKNTVDERIREQLRRSGIRVSDVAGRRSRRRGSTWTADAPGTAEQVERDAAENGWYSTNWGWVSPETAKRALAAGIPPGGDVPGYLRCGTIGGESPTSGEVQSWNQGLDPVPPGYESYLVPNATPYAGESEGQ